MGRDADASEARRLLRAARSGALATAGPDGPHAALVTPATTIEGDVMLLLSGLSAHTGALAAAPDCALLVAGAPVDANPQTAPRLTVHGRAVRLDPATDREGEATARARFLAIHPYAAFYAGFGDFALWRIRPTRFSFVGGFGRARRFDAADLLPSPEAAASIVAEADALLGEAPLRALGAVAVDGDGVDRPAPDGGTRRDAFDAPADDPAAIRRALLVGRLPLD